MFLEVYIMIETFKVWSLWSLNLWNLWIPWNPLVFWFNAFFSEKFKNFSEKELKIIYELCDDTIITGTQKKEYLSFVREMKVVFEEGFYPEMYV
jgi:hypothetical protein